jgi:hypothetical protein
MLVKRGKRWEKGQSGNPAGRPKLFFSFKKTLENKLAEVDPRDYRGRTYGQIIVDRVVELATARSKANVNLRAISEVIDRLEGKPLQATTLDATVTSRTREQREARLAELLTILPKPDADEPSEPAA